MSEVRLVVGPAEHKKRLTLGQRIRVGFPKQGDEQQISIMIETRPGNITQKVQLSETEFHKTMMLWAENAGVELAWGGNLQEAMDRAAAAAVKADRQKTAASQKAHPAPKVGRPRGRPRKVDGSSPVAKSGEGSGKGRRRKTADSPAEKTAGNCSLPENDSASRIVDTPDAPVDGQPDGGGAPDFTGGEG